MNRISVKNVSLEINQELILQDINFEIGEGEILGIVGRNGSGKSMLMKCICGFVKPSSGEIEVSGGIIGKTVDFPSGVGIMIENPGFVPQYSGYRNLKILSELNGMISKKEIRESMRLVGLNPSLKRSVRKYSLGMKQRLGIAQAIMENPDVLILDEPMNGLDVDGVEEIRNLLLKYKKSGKSILIASHIVEDIQILCDNVIHLEHGEIV